jgi:putative ABC transport system ATP-binding protein
MTRAGLPWHIQGGGGDPVLELAGITKTYPGSPPVAALAGVDLRVAAGERVAVLGPSGSGKSTLLHILGTLERPTSGVLRLAGRDVSCLSDAEVSAVRGHELGFVFQQFYLLDHLDAVGNVALGLLYRGGSARERRRAAVGALDRVGLGHRLTHRPQQLSGGERQRVAIARAIAGRASVVLADEPTGNLDTATGSGIVALLTEIASDGTAVVVVTHDTGIASAMDRQVEMRDGHILSDSALAAIAPPGRAGVCAGASAQAGVRTAPVTATRPQQP